MSLTLAIVNEEMDYYDEDDLSRERGYDINKILKGYIQFEGSFSVNYRTKIREIILNKASDPNQRTCKTDDDDRQHPLQRAVIAIGMSFNTRGRDVEMVKSERLFMKEVISRLLANGARKCLNLSFGENNAYPTEAAINYNNDVIPDVVKMLLDNGADIPNILDRSKYDQRILDILDAEKAKRKAYWDKVKEEEARKKTIVGKVSSLFGPKKGGKLLKTKGKSKKAKK
jgi:hypothetical protein